MSQLKVGINGFGRIGRVLFRAGFEKLNIVGINDLTNSQTLAHLLEYDSTHGKFNKKINSKENLIIVDGKEIPVSAFKDPTQIPWSKWGVDIVLECSGAFTKGPDIQKHFQGGVKKVIVSAPAEGADLTVVYGVNHHSYDSTKHKILSNASCTTNCLAPVAKVLHETFGIEQGLMTTVHSYTNDQKILDAPHKDIRRARSAALSMIPTTTGAAKAVGLVLPELKGKIDGVAIRVPTPNVSLVDFVVITKKPVTKESVNEAFKNASQSSLKGVLYCEEKELVSCDFNGNPFSSIVDLSLTQVSGTNMVKVFSWYDNETGFSNRMVDLVKYMESKGL